MGTKIRNPSGKFQVHDLTEVGNGWKLYTYETGGTFATPKATYKDSNGTDAHTNPIIFDSRGEKDIWWDGLYDLKLTESDGTLVWTMEDFGQGAFEGEARTGPQATTYNMASDADYTLTSTQEGYGRIIITDTVTVLTTGRNIICSTDEKGYYLQNDTAQTLTLKTSAGTGIEVPAGEQTLLFCDGTNVVRAFNSSSRLSAITITPASDADVTLTAAQYAYRRLILADGSWTSGHNIIVPDEERVFYVDNSSGTYDAVIKTSTGTGVTVKSGFSHLVLCDGTNVIYPDQLDITGQTAETSIATSDEALLYDASASANRKATVANIRVAMMPVAQADIDTSAVGQGELKSTTASQSSVTTTNSYDELALTGSTYTMFWTLGNSMTGGAPDPNDATTTSAWGPIHNDGTYAAKVGWYNANAVSVTFYLYSRYIQASPPWFYGAVEIPIFLLVMLDKNTKEILGTYAAADPPHAYHGPHDLHPVIGRLEKAFGFWGKSLAERRQDPEFLPKLREMNRLKQQGGKDLEVILKANTFTMDEKNIDMNLVPHLFYGFDPAKHVVVMLDPLDPMTEEHALLQELVGTENIGDEHISQLLHNNYIQIDNTPLSIACPNSVMACKYRMRNNV